MCAQRVGRRWIEGVVMNGRRLWAMARKEAIQLRRDRRSLLLAFLLPALLVILFSYAISWDVRDIPLAVADESHSAEGRDLVDAFESSGYFAVQRIERREIDRILDRGVAQMVLVIPGDFASDIGARRPPTLQIIVDGGDANTATIALGYARGIVQAFGARLAPASGDPRAPIEVASRIWYNPELESRNMIVPGLVAVIMMIIAAMLTSLTIAREWERGTLEQLASTPVRRSEIVIGKLLPYLAIGLIDVVVVSLIGVFWFGVPFRGSAALLLALSLAFLAGALGLGMFISALARNQLLATQVAMIATFLPAFLLSGFMYAIEVMPRVLQLVTYLVPARYFLVVTRGVFLKGVGMETLWVQGLIMIGFAAAGIAAAVLVFRKELRG
jgi:ABC-2 type transport system permease protein